MPQDKQRGEEFSTLADLLAALVEGMNAELAGEEVSAATPQLDVSTVVEGVLAATGRQQDDLDIEVDPDMVDQMIDAIVQWVRAKHGIAFAIPADPNEDTTFEELAQTVLSAALADQDMDVIPRVALRTPTVIEYLNDLLLAVAKIAWEVDRVFEGEEEVAFWEQAMGAIIADPVMRGSFMKALQAHVDQQDAFLRLLRPKLVALEGGVRIKSLRRAIDQAEHALLAAAAKSELGPTAWGQKSGTGGMAS